MTASEFSKAFQNHYSYIQKFALKLTRSKFDADDLIQETAVKAYRKLNKLEDKNKFKSWINTILYTTYLNAFNKKSRRRDLLDKEVGKNMHFFNNKKVLNKGFENLKAQDIITKTKNVGPQSMRAFNLYLKGFSYADIASKLSISLGTVKSRIHFARSKMKQELANEVF